MSKAGKRTNLFLTGMMGSGKSSLGKLVAVDLGYSFVDTDAVIQERCSMTVAEIFAGKGESFFREEEDKLLREVADRDQQVIATGGGMLLSAANREVAKRAGMVILLRASMEVLISRVGSDPRRPLLGNHNPLTRLTEIYEERRQAYQEFPMQVFTDTQSIRKTADAIVEVYRAWRKS